MAKLAWHAAGTRRYETGVKMGVLYPMASDGSYEAGVAWNGLTAFNESPSGAEASKLYADDQIYATLYSTEEFGGTLEAYTYPAAFEACDGSASLATGVTIGQQERRAFGLCYRTSIGNEIQGSDFGYKLHLVYGCKASPSERSHATINDSPEAETLSWEITTTPVEVAGFKPTATLVIDSTTADAAKLAALEDLLYGTASTEASLPTPDEVYALFNAAPESPEDGQ